MKIQQQQIIQSRNHNGSQVPIANVQNQYQQSQQQLQQQYQQRGQGQLTQQHNQNVIRQQQDLQSQMSSLVSQINPPPSTQVSQREEEENNTSQSQNVPIANMPNANNTLPNFTISSIYNDRV